MKTLCVRYSERATLPERVEKKAADLGITTEELIKRFISAGMAELDPKPGSALPGSTLEDFLVKNGVWVGDCGKGD